MLCQRPSPPPRGAPRPDPHPAGADGQSGPGPSLDWSGAGASSVLQNTVPLPGGSPLTIWSAGAQTIRGEPEVRGATFYVDRYPFPQTGPEHDGRHDQAIAAFAGHPSFGRLAQRLHAWLQGDGILEFRCLSGKQQSVTAAIITAHATRILAGRPALSHHTVLALTGCACRCGHCEGTLAGPGGTILQAHALTLAVQSWACAVGVVMPVSSPTPGPPPTPAAPASSSGAPYSPPGGASPAGWRPEPAPPFRAGHCGWLSSGDANSFAARMEARLAQKAVKADQLNLEAISKKQIAADLRRHGLLSARGTKAGEHFNYASACGRACRHGAGEARRGRAPRDAH